MPSCFGVREMKINTSLIVLIVIFAVLLVVVFAHQRKTQTIIDEQTQEQNTPFFPGLTADQVFRIEINSLQDGSLLFRREAGVWEVATGKDVLSQLMSQQPEEETEPVDTDESVDIAPDDSEPVDEESPVEPLPWEAETEEEPAEEEEAEEEEELSDPRQDTGPSGDMWRRFYRSKEEMVDNMIEQIIGLRHTQLVTSDVDKKTEFKVLNNIVGLEIFVYDQGMNTLASIIIGDHDPAFTSCYVRVPDEDDIYKVSGALKRAFGTSLEYIRDPRIFYASPETVIAYSLVDRDRGSEYELARVEGIWRGTDADGVEFDLGAQEVDDLLDQIGQLNSSSFVDKSRPPTPPPDDETWDEMDPYGILHPTIEVEFTTSDGVSHALRIGRKEGTSYYAATEDDMNDIFRISMSVVDTLRPTPEMLAPDEGISEVVE